MRKVLFWLHLSAGVTAGAIILIMCVTGVLLTFERQTLDWADRKNARVVPSPGAGRLSMADLIAKSGGTPAGVVVRSDPAEPVELVMGRDRTIYLNPYTGAVSGQPSKRAHAVFEGIRGWHRWIAMSDATRKETAPVYSAANVIFLFIVISGPFLWWPKKLTWQHLRPIVWFRGGLPGKARDFNWHSVIGLWTSIPLLLIVASGIVLSYSWANNLLYRLTGTQMPKFWQIDKPRKGETLPPAWQGLDQWIARAQNRMPDWRTITVRNVPSRTVSVGIDSGTGGQPQTRATLTIDRFTGNEVKWETFGDFNLGYKLRIMARFFHTGEVGGMSVQALAGLVSLGGAVMVYTGIALSLRRLVAWRRRRAKTAVPATAGVA
jgi:uncharacterized iron-regulated membrane protein